jgi:hypothetical protein
MTHRRTSRPASSRRTRRLVAATLAAGALVGATAAASTGLVAPGTPARDVHVGGDDDNADNSLIQPPGVTVPQHMDNTDLLFGRENKDLLIGRLGSDTLIAGESSDILVGGPDQGESPSSDVEVGDEGKDIAIWSPGDGNDAYAGQEGSDTMVFGSLVEKNSGDLLLTRFNGRSIPRVDIDGQSGVGCTIVHVPASHGFGYQYLVRFDVAGSPVATVRQKDVEKVYCPSPHEGRARVAELTGAHPAFHGVNLDKVPGTVGAILAPVE